MPIAKIQLPDGRIARFEVPEGTTQEEVLAFAQQNIESFQADQETQQSMPAQDQAPLNITQFRPREEILKELTMAQSTLSRANRDVNLPKIQDLIAELEASGGSASSGVIEPVATMVSGIVAEPLAGIAGLAQTANPFADPGAGVRAIEATREALTFKPRTKAGREGLQAVGEFISPVGEFIAGTEEALGNAVFDATDSPALATAATMIPAAIMEAVGVGVGGRVTRGSTRVNPSKRTIRAKLTEAAPDPEVLKDVSRGIYNELSESGIKLTPEAYKKMFDNVARAAKKSGLSKRTTKKSFGALKDLKDELGNAVDIADVDDLRKVVGGVAGDLDPTEKSIARSMITEIDDFLDGVDTNGLIVPEGVNASNVGKKYAAARNLWGRARKSELVTEAIETAKGRASGFENGIRIELGKLAKNKKTKKFFTKQELNAIKDIEKGNFAQNFSKFLGRFAFNEGRANNTLSALGGVAGGATVGGPVGAVAVPVVGQTARGIAAKLTKGRAEFLDSVIRAGSNGEEIVKAYLTTVPKGQRRPADLSRLLSDPSIDLTNLMESSNRTIKQAAEIAAGNQVLGQAAGALAPTALRQEEEQ